MKIYCLDNKASFTNRWDLSILENLECKESYDFAPSRHEYFVVTLLALSDYTAYDLDVRLESLKSLEHEIEGAVTCFNTMGLDSFGQKMERKLDMLQNRIQPIFVGIDFSKARIDRYSTVIHIGDESIELRFDLNDELVFNEGLNEKGSLSRLKWLNSDIAIDQEPASGYPKPELDGNVVKIKGRDLVVSDTGLIANCHSYFDGSNKLSKEVQSELFYKPMEIDADGIKFEFSKLEIENKLSHVDIVSKGRNEKAIISIESSIKYDGSIGYVVRLKSLDGDLLLRNLGISLYFKASRYFMGLGYKSARIDSNISLSKKWEEPCNNQLFFIGDVNCGARVKLYSEKIDNSVVGYFKEANMGLSSALLNYGKGSVDVFSEEEGVVARINTGTLVAFADKEIKVEFEIDMTPYDELSAKRILGLRIGESQLEGSFEQALRKSKNAKMGYIVQRYGSPEYKFSNYPFENMQALEKLAQKAKRAGSAFGLEYNLRSISTRDPNVFIFNFLDDEVFLTARKDTTGHKDVDDALDSNVIVDGLMIERDKGSFKKKYDFPILVRPQSRYNNFFMESLKLLVDTLNLQCLSLSDPSMDKFTAERAKKVISSTRFGNGIVELRLSDQMNPENGNASATCKYAGLMPYVDKLWFDKQFDPSESVDERLLEHTGNVFGLATSVSPGTPLSLALAIGAIPKYGIDSLADETLESFYELVDRHGFEDAEFYGYWDDLNPIRVDNSEVFSSCFVKDDAILFSLYNQSEKKQVCEIGVETKFGVTTADKTLWKPFLGIEQEEGRFDITKSIRLKPYSGIVVIGTRRLGASFGKKGKGKL